MAINRRTVATFPSVWALPVVLIVSIFSTAAAVQAGPVSPEMRDGIAAYNKGDYRTAVGLLQGALSTEFNNAVLHYYLGNCFMHMKQSESAIREFRIAYAIAPESDAGKYAKEALKLCGIDADGDSSDMREPEPPKPKAPPKNPLLDQAINSLRKQTFFAKDYETKANDFLAADAKRRAQEQFERVKKDITEQNTLTRRGHKIQLPIPEDSQKLLDNLEKQFDSQANARRRANETRVDEIQRSADNLETLLTEKNNRGGVKLKPAGTNLFIRNYEVPPKTGSRTKAPTSSRTPSASIVESAGSVHGQTGTPSVDDNPFTIP